MIKKSLQGYLDGRQKIKIKVLEFVHIYNSQDKRKSVDRGSQYTGELR